MSRSKAEGTESHVLSPSLLTISRMALANHGHISHDQLNTPPLCPRIDYIEKGAQKPHRGIE